MGNFNRGGRFGGRRDFQRRDFSDRGSREMHKAVCSDCGKDCEVPFRPTGNKPVFCSECFEKKNAGSDSRRFDNRDSRRPSFEGRNDGRPQNNAQLEMINSKLDRILGILAPSIPALVVPEEKIVKEEIKVKPKRVIKIKKTTSTKEK